jgi:hypothetical protein
VIASTAARRTGVRHRRHSVVWRDRDVHDRAGSGWPHRQAMGDLRHRQRAADVQPLDRTPALRGDPLGGHEVLAARVVEQQVEPAVAIQNRANDPLGFRSFADVPAGVSAAFTDLGDGVRQDLLAATGDHDRRAAAGQLGRGRLAQVRTPAGDQRDPAVEGVGCENLGRLQRYSPNTLITSRLGRPPSNSQ